MIQDIYPHVLKNRFEPSKRPDGNSLILSFSGNDVIYTYDLSTLDGVTEDVIDIVKTYFKGGDCLNYPYTFNGFNLGETADSSVIENDIKNLSENITDLTITVSGSRELEDYEVYNITDVQVSYV